MLRVWGRILFVLFVVLCCYGRRQGVTVQEEWSVFDVEGVADAVAKEHECKDQEHDGCTGQEGKVGAVEQDIAVVLFDHGTPRGHGGLHTDAKEAEAGLEEDGAGEVGGGYDNDGTRYVGQDVAEDGAEGADAEGACGFDVFFLLDAVDLSAHHAGDVDPHGEADGDEHLPESLAQSKGDGDDQQHGGDGPHDIDEPGDEVVDPSAIVGGQGTEGDAYEQGDEHSDKAYRETDAAADNNHAEHVAAVAVGAEGEGACALLHYLRGCHSAYRAVVGHGAGVGFDVDTVAYGGDAVGGYGGGVEWVAAEHGAQPGLPHGRLAVVDVGELYA